MLSRENRHGEFEHLKMAGVDEDFTMDIGIH